MTDVTPQKAPGATKDKDATEQRRLKGSIILRDRGENSAWTRYMHAMDLGMTKGDAADYSGIGAATIRLWRNCADADEKDGLETVFMEFFAAVNSTRSEMLSRNLDTVETCRSLGDLKAATWLLERHGYHKKTEVDANVSATLTYVIDNQDEGA